MAFTKDQLVAHLRDSDAFLAGKRIKFDFGDAGLVLVDGVARQVREEDGDADTTIAIAWDDFQALAAGQLNPMTAYMSGRLKLAGDLSAALQLQQLFSGLKG